MPDIIFIVLFILFIFIELIQVIRKKELFKNNSNISFYSFIFIAVILLLDVSSEGGRYGYVVALTIFIVMNLILFFKEKRKDK